MSNPDDYRDEQFASIERKLKRLQRRYFNLDLAYEYRIWVLDQRARPDDRCVDLEYDFMQYLERRNRRAEEAAGGKRWEPAFDAAKHLLSGFALLVAHWRIEAFMTRETAEVYAEKFKSWTEAEFTAACWAVIGTHRGHFPLIADIRAAREDSDGSVPEAATRDETTARDMDRRAELDKRIAELPDDARAELNEKAKEQMNEIPDKGNLDLKARMRQVFERLAFEALDREIEELPEPDREVLVAIASGHGVHRGDEHFQNILREVFLRQAYTARHEAGIETGAEVTPE